MFSKANSLGQEFKLLLKYFQDVDGSIRKQGCKWILTSHDTILVQQLVSFHIYSFTDLNIYNKCP